ncbi:rhodanese-like domain-containing protein 10 [Nicotiana tabacum]|uniref:Rhodanese-like domain-containing protein 10 n=2 Tax=Nicotiana TaxID=4085 RepID=A0A1S3Z0H7_TOBAC|nr:PREDICTED: rhodanese-like domain-containing protein 10 [Nicotiana sylvestris]XP_016457875.1 PREDICTED: rhodanese-like domain-containing protein 10 [Nicotiana tabacum]
MALIQLQSSILKYNKQLQIPSFSTASQRSTILRINAVSVNGQQLIQSGKVRPILPKEAAAAMETEGYILLDIRPEWERAKACVSGSLHVPLFLKDMDNSPITLLKKWVHFGYIGAWTGQNFTMINDDFVKQVEQQIPDKDNAKVLVACGEGLRSLMAISKLHKGEYKNLAWLVGGFTRASDSDFPAVEGPEKLQYATIGGVSYYLLQLLVLLKVVGKES